MNNFNVSVFEPLLGRTIVKIEGAEKDSEEILFTLENGDIFRMYHKQDCCEDVRVEDVGGNINSLIGNPLLLAEEVTNEGEVEYGDTCTWTWYHFATIKGYVTIRWYGVSNGYYSESVDHEWIKKGTRNMLKIENTEVLGWEHAIRGMRNPMNSWEKSDSYENYSVDYEKDETTGEVAEIRFPYYRVGAGDLNLMTRLRNAGTDHRKFMRMIAVYVDLIAPLYWWKEFDTYKVGTVANSCSTMHKIAAKEFTQDDFSREHLFGPDDMLKWDERKDIAKDNALAAVNVDGNWCYFTPQGYIQMTCNILNHYREKYLETQDKRYWWQMIQLLPSSYNQRRTVMLNYEVLANIYKSRRNHKLDEWHTFCDWIEGLPYSELITGPA